MQKRMKLQIQKKAAIAHAIAVIVEAVSRRHHIPQTNCNTTTEPTLLTPKDAACVVGVSPKTLANWRVSGVHELPFVKVGSRVRYRSNDVHTFLIKASKQSTSDRGAK